MIFIILFAGLMSLIGTMIGSLIGTFVKNPSNKLLSFIFFISSIFMLFVVIFDLIPESIKSLGTLQTIVLNIIVVLVLYILNKILMGSFSDNMVKLAFITTLGLMIHNFPEGILMGTGLMINKNFGIRLCLVIMLHDIPEGLAVAAPLLYKGESVNKIMLYTLITSIPTFIGAMFGVYLGANHNGSLMYSLVLASGIMIYISIFELIPKAIDLSLIFAKAHNIRTKEIK